MSMGGGPVGGVSPQPTGIRESETQAYTEVNKKFTLAILPEDTMEVVSYVDREMKMYWQYDATPTNPTLRPLMHLRMATASEIDEKMWQPIHEELIEKLPKEIKELLLAELSKPLNDRNSSFVALNLVLGIAAKVISWANKTGGPVAAESPAGIQNELNVALPYIALKGLNLSELTLMKNELHAVGANFAGFDSVSNLLTEMNGAIKQMSGTNPPMSIIADKLAKLEGPPTDTFQIVQTTLHALSVVASAFTLEFGSPAMLIGLSIATIGLEGTAGIEKAFSEAIHKAVPFGARPELAELNSLKKELLLMRGH